MGHDAVELDALESPERSRELRQFVEPNSEPAHSRVDFEMEIDDAAHRAGARVQLFDLIETIGRRCQVARDQIIGLPAPESAEAKNRSRGSRPAALNFLRAQPPGR